jgi:hypothetical protein
MNIDINRYKDWYKNASIFVKLGTSYGEIDKLDKKRLLGVERNESQMDTTKI